jgi:dienelactone hydrolase
MASSTKVSLLLAIAGTSSLVFGAEPKFVDPVPAGVALTIQQKVPYHKVGDRELVLDHYRSANASGKLPVLIFVNAFGGDSQREWDIYQSWAKLAASKGFLAINPDSHSEAVEDDFDHLIAYIRNHAAQLHADPERIAVYAASGHVGRAFPMLQDPKRTGVKAAIIYYGTANPKSVSEFRLDLPMLFVRAGLDRPGMNAGLDALAAAAVKANAPVQVLNHPGGHHGFEVLDNDDASRVVIRETLAFAMRATEPSYHAALRATANEVRASSAYGVGDFAKAAELYAVIVPNRPTDIRLLLSYGEALLGARQYSKAREQFTKVKQLGGAGARDLGIPAARAATLDGDLEDAVRWLQSIPARYRPASMANDPAFAVLRDRPDFQALFKQ